MFEPQAARPAAPTSTGRAGLLLAVAALAVAALAAPRPAAASEAQEQKLELARQAYQELLDIPEGKVPRKLLEEARCLAVIPRVIKGAFGWGGRHGRGVLTCRDSEGVWSPPLFVQISGGSFGFQIGAQSTDFVLFFMSQKSVQSLLSSRFVLGGDASIAAGPLGRTAALATDLKLNAEIYSYAKTRGFFAGLSLEGARLAPNQKWVARFYGRRLDPASLLFDHEAPSVPEAARRFLAVLP